VFLIKLISFDFDNNYNFNGSVSLAFKHLENHLHSRS